MDNNNYCVIKLEKDENPTLISMNLAIEDAERILKSCIEQDNKSEYKLAEYYEEEDFLYVFDDEDEDEEDL